MSDVVTEKSWTITPVGVGRRDYSQNVERYDAEPTMLLLEGFEQLPPSWRILGTAGYSVTRDTTRAWRGGACLKLTTGNVAADNEAEYGQYFGMVRSLKLLADLHITIPTANGIRLVWALHRTTATQWISFAIRYDIINEKWEYFTPLGLWLDIPDGAQRLARSNATVVFHHIWLAIDFQSLEYLYAQCNEKMMPMKGLTPRIRAPVGLPLSSVEYTGASGANPNVDFYIDNARVAEVVP